MATVLVRWLSYKNFFGLVYLMIIMLLYGIIAIDRRQIKQ